MATSERLFSSCNLCSKRIRLHQYYLNCTSCHYRYHYQCVNRTRSEFDNEDKNGYLCYKCLEGELPFNHFDQDFDFFNALSEFWFQGNTLDFRQLGEKLFVPFEINEHFNLNIPTCDADPDTNFFNDMHNPGSVTCDYHIEDSFCHLKQVHSLDNCFSLYHVNARSLVNKKDKLLEHLQCLNTNFKFICV